VTGPDHIALNGQEWQDRLNNGIDVCRGGGDLSGLRLDSQETRDLVDCERAGADSQPGQEKNRLAARLERVQELADQVGHWWRGALESLQSLIERLRALLRAQSFGEHDGPEERSLGSIKDGGNDDLLLITRLFGEERNVSQSADRDGVDIVAGVLRPDLVCLTARSVRQRQRLGESHKLRPLATADSLGEPLEELLASLLTTLDLVDAIDDDDAAVRTLEGTLQSLDQGSPEVFFVRLWVGCAAGFVVCVDERVVPEQIESVLRLDRGSVC
jgi:hypothetical protein